MKKLTTSERIAAKYPGYSKVAGPYNVVQPMLEQLALAQQQMAAKALKQRLETDSTAKLVCVGRRAFIITQMKRVTAEKNGLVVSGAFQVKAGRGGWK